jgi:hypothetical protein
MPLTKFRGRFGFVSEEITACRNALLMLVVAESVTGGYMDQYAIRLHVHVLGRERTVVDITVYDTGRYVMVTLPYEMNEEKEDCRTIYALFGLGIRGEWALVSTPRVNHDPKDESSAAYKAAIYRLLLIRD